MTERRILRGAAAALIILAGAFALAPSSSRAHAADDSPQAVIERIAPQLRSQDEDVRERAERKLFALGQDGRRELERLAQGTDPALSSLALRLLGRDEWKRVEVAGEPAQDDGRERPLEEQIRKLELDFGQRFEELRRRLRDGVAQRIDLDHLENAADANAVVSGTVVENGRSFAWSRDAEGRFEVTVKDGPDAEQRRYSFDSLEAARETEPEIAKRLEEQLARMPRFELDLPDSWLRMPEFKFPEEQMRNVRRHLRDLVDPDDHAGAAGSVLGINWEEPSEVLRVQLDLPERAMVVTEVGKDTLAERLGLERHDVLLTLAGQPVSAPDDVRKALETVAEGDTLGAEIMRKGRRITIDTKR